MASQNRPVMLADVINGVPTTRYTGTYTLAAGLRHLSPALQQLMAPGLPSVTVTTQFTIWIDSQHIVRREVATQPAPGGGDVVTTVVVTSIDQPVTVHKPPASQVTGMPGL